MSGAPAHGGAPARVLVVDDSAFARKVLREVLTRAGGLEVVGIARDGLEALEKVQELRPDVVTLDLVMPGLDGLGFLDALQGAGLSPVPRVVVVSVSGQDSELGLEALGRGAVELVQKPTALATDRLYELNAELVHKVRAAALARPHVPAPLHTPPPLPPAVEAGTCAVDIVAVGTSTGGPQALTTLLRTLPAGLPVPVVLALHIPAGYTQTLAERVNAQSALTVVEAHEGLELVPGLVALAPGGRHLTVERRADGVLVAHVGMEPLATPHHPSVDVLLRSVAQAAGTRALGVVLTGMGDDGLEGARAIRRAGGRMLTESERSCVVYGMPRVVAEAGLSQGSAPIEQMAGLIVQQLG